MDTIGSIYPMRVFIKHKAKEQFKRDSEMCQLCLPLDEELFQELAQTLFRAESNQVLYEECRSREEASTIEDAIAADLAETYVHLKLRQRHPIVSTLNSLLSADADY